MDHFQSSFNVISINCTTKQNLRITHQTPPTLLRISKMLMIALGNFFNISLAEINPPRP